MSCHVLSVVVGGLESSQTDFVPESDSDDDDAARGADECLVKGLVEETQVYDDDDDDGGGVHGNSTVLADDDAARGADECLVKGLVEETQVYVDDGGGVHGNSTVLDDVASEQVITHFS